MGFTRAQASHVELLGQYYAARYAPLFASAPFAIQLANFFLGCVLLAGLYGAMTASKKILYIQAIPALIALIVLNVF